MGDPAQRQLAAAPREPEGSRTAPDRRSVLRTVRRPVRRPTVLAELQHLGIRSWPATPAWSASSAPARRFTGPNATAGAAAAHRRRLPDRTTRVRSASRSLPALDARSRHELEASPAAGPLSAVAPACSSTPTAVPTLRRSTSRLSGSLAPSGLVSIPSRCSRPGRRDPRRATTTSRSTTPGASVRALRRAAGDWDRETVALFLGPIPAAAKRATKPAAADDRSAGHDDEPIAGLRSRRPALQRAGRASTSSGRSSSSFMHAQPAGSELVFVDDGSDDATHRPGRGADRQEPRQSRSRSSAGPTPGRARPSRPGWPRSPRRGRRSATSTSRRPSTS